MDSSEKKQLQEEIGGLTDDYDAVHASLAQLKENALTPEEAKHIDEQAVIGRHSLFQPIDGGCAVCRSATAKLRAISASSGEPK